MMMMKQLYVGSGHFITRSSGITDVRQMGRYICPILGLQSYRQHSTLIPSIEVPTFNKVVIPVFTMLVPGSIASIHSLRCNIKKQRSLYNFITRNKIIHYILHSSFGYLITMQLK